MAFIKPGQTEFDSHLIGAPKLETFPPLSAQELQQYFELPVKEALARGVPPQSGCCPNGIPLAFVARIIRTVHLMAEEVTKLMDVMVQLDRSGELTDEIKEQISALVPPPMIKVDAAETPQS